MVRPPSFRTTVAMQPVALGVEGELPSAPPLPLIEHLHGAGTGVLIVINRASLTKVRYKSAHHRQGYPLRSRYKLPSRDYLCQSLPKCAGTALLSGGYRFEGSGGTGSKRVNAQPSGVARLRGRPGLDRGGLQGRNDGGSQGG
jgi:hypothetical protein